MRLGWLLLLAPIMSALLTGMLRRYALARRVLDIPNERSLHTTPTPRGGGVAIVLTFLTGVGLMVAWRLLEPLVAIAICGAGVAVAAVGFVDDHIHVPAHWRLVTHFAAAAWIVAWIGGLPTLIVFGRPMDLGWPGYVIAALGVVWLLNLYNFMDGIDGIAALEAMTVGFGAAALEIGRPGAGHGWALPALLAATALGFLLWNWPPAKVFLGDAGSGFLGLTLGALWIHSSRATPELLWSWAILLGVFVVDATVTLLRRVYRGAKSYEAHRDHAYQHAALQHGAHVWVTIAIGALNLFWLLPLAWLVAEARLDGLVGLLIAYTPLVWLGIRYEAGITHRREVVD